MDISVKITKARADLAFDSPFFGSIAIRLKMVEKADLNPPTMAVDGKHIFYHPEYAEMLSEDELKGDIIHEVLHVAMLHHTRRSGRKPKKWNIACDYAINPICKQNGFKMYAPTTLDDPKFHGMSAEQIYDLLPDDPEDDMGNALEPKDSLIEPETEMERVEAEIEAKELQSTAMAAGKDAGRMPSGMERLIIALQEPQVRWQDQLRDYLTTPARGNPKWHIPNHRLAELAHLPYYDKEYKGNIAVLFDVSGSMSRRDIQACGAEVAEIAQDNHIEEMHVIYVSTHVTKVEYFDLNQDEVKLEPNIGGGTYFHPGFDYMKENDIQPDAVVYFTDGYADFNFEQPDLPVIWCITSDVIAPWGKTVKIDKAKI